MKNFSFSLSALVLLAAFVCSAENPAWCDESIKAVGGSVVTSNDGSLGGEASFHASRPVDGAGYGGGQIDLAAGFLGKSPTGRIGLWGMSGGVAMGDAAYLRSNGTQTVFGADPFFLIGVGAQSPGVSFAFWPKMAGFYDKRASSDVQLAGGVQAALVVNPNDKMRFDLLGQALASSVGPSGNLKEVAYVMLAAEGRFQAMKNFNITAGVEVSKILADTDALKEVSRANTDANAPVVVGKLGGEVVF